MTGPIQPIQTSAPSGPSHPHTANVIAFYEALTPETLTRLDAIYADDARFIDPFNDV